MIAGKFIARLHALARTGGIRVFRNEEPAAPAPADAEIGRASGRERV